MIPYKYRSYYPGRSGMQNVGWAKSPPDFPGALSNNGQQPQPRIQVNSTIDADIVLRRVIEDRAAILALKSRTETNEAELMKAKTRQMNITKILEGQDQEIAKLTTKAKCELTEYNESSREYIRGFMLAFERGDMDKLPRHPFAPSLEELEKAINRRKATLIEKVQADDRVKKLEFINSQERVTTKVLKKNEEAFLRAIEIAKQQFSDSCETWLDRAHRLLSSAPHHAQTLGNTKKHVLEAQIPKVQVQAPPLEAFGASYPQVSQRTFAQETELPQGNRFVIPEIPVNEGIVSPEVRPKKLPSFQPVSPGMDFALHPGLVREESAGNKRQKTDHEPVESPASPVMESHSDDRNTQDQQCAPEQQVDVQSSAKQSSTSDDDRKEELSIAQVLTSMQGDGERFEVAQI